MRSEEELLHKLERIVRMSPWFSAALRAVRELQLASWCIGAGAIRNLVWDELHGFSTPSLLSDLDVAYFDSSDTSSERDVEILTALQALDPNTPWEVTNQAGVHLWFEQYFGHPVEPLGSLEDAVASWPEFATAVGVILDDDDRIRIIAPYGLADLFSMVVRRNPKRVSVDTYRQRVAQKRYTERWPRVEIIAV